MGDAALHRRRARLVGVDRVVALARERGTYLVPTDGYDVVAGALAEVGTDVPGSQGAG